MDRVKANHFFGGAQIAGAAAMSFMHGAQDGQKFIGVLFLGIAFAGGHNSVSGMEDSGVADAPLQYRNGSWNECRRRKNY